MKIKNKNRNINEDTIEIQNLFRYKKRFNFLAINVKVMITQ